MTKDIQRAILRACARFIGKKVDPITKDIGELRTQIAGTFTKADITEIQKAWEEKFSKPGPWFSKELLPPGPPGKDAEPVEVSEVVAELLVCDELKTLVDLHVAEAVAQYFDANPVQHGKDGAPGEKGDPGDRGEPGRDGADGLDVKELLRADGGRLMAVMSDGTTKDLGQFVGKDGQPGKDGRDGLSAENFEREYLSDSHEIRERWTVGDQVKELTYPAGGIRYIGYWREGAEAKGGDATTHDGTLWVALRDTKTKPSRESSDWNIGARKGRDGLQGPAGKEYKPPEPVKLT